MASESDLSSLASAGDSDSDSALDDDGDAIPRQWRSALDTPPAAAQPPAQTRSPTRELNIETWIGLDYLARGS